MLIRSKTGTGRRWWASTAATTTKWASRTIVPLIINGKDVVTKESFAVIGPKKNAQVWSASSASVNDAVDAADGASAAFPSWAETQPQARRDILLRAAGIMTRRKEELGYYMEQEIGANAMYKDFILGLTIEHLKDTAGRIAGAVTGMLPESFYNAMKAMVQKKPYGVILGIALWNAPYNLGLRSILYPIAAGNTAVLKGSELAPHCYWTIADVLREAGLPDGVLNFVFHRPEDAVSITNALIAHPAIRKLNFTGGSKVGAILASEAGKHLKLTLMELGGKANAIVLKDADLKNAARCCLLGAFINAGQICMSTERILVDRSVASEFKQILQKTVNQMFGSPEATPILVTVCSARRNRALIQDATSKGASTLNIFKKPMVPTKGVETHIQPTIVTDVSQAMDIYGGESFGPSVSLYCFDSIEEATALANDTAYGLSSSIYTEDLKTAFRISNQLESGAVHINSMTVHDENALPHGGVKASGFGRFNGYEGLDEFLYYKSVTWLE
ncbi:hypothetical protein G7054_g12419 [Neopestalotiopsis clavispora]|nr:hypothetical protein G7054_g12419 [Neopestalotiopsis clavispora]